MARTTAEPAPARRAEPAAARRAEPAPARRPEPAPARRAGAGAERGAESSNRSAARARARTHARARRTQSERREASRAALLDAAVDCLIEDGYARLTTRRVAERAGVSQGTQMHYFPTKTTFLTEAIRHVSRRLADEALARTVRPSLDEAARCGAMLDELWRVHNEPVFHAALELWIAARTDEELRAEMRELDRDLSHLLLESATEMFPGRADDADFRVRLEMTLALIRGLAMTRVVVGSRTVQTRWRAMREHLMTLLEP